MLYDFELDKARKSLPRYFRILEGKELPNFIKAKKLKIDFREEMELQELWKIHREAMVRLKKRKEGDGKKNLLELKAVIAEKMMERCELCEFKCGINRKEEMGYCRVKDSKIASYFIHLGEEPELVPSFTVFFSGCNFRCVFCQNWDISQRSVGIFIFPQKMARIIEEAFLNGARNVNFVGGEPTPNLPYILKVLTYLETPIPVIWNSNMYMSLEALELLNGIVDIYLGDFKWSSNSLGRKYSTAPQYWDVITRNFKIVTAHQGAELLIRHLVIPNNLENTRRVLRWIRENLGTQVRVNVMFQYQPYYRASHYPEINRKLNYSEMREVEKMVKKLGFSYALVG